MTQRRHYGRVGLIGGGLLVLTLSGTLLNLPATAAPPPNAAPIADLVLNPASVAVGATMIADASGSTDDVAVTSWTYAWGDGTKDRKEPASTLTHVYAKPGKYTVKLTVRDRMGKASSTSKLLTVTASPPPGNTAPVASVTAKKVNANDVTLDGGASKDDKGIKSFKYDFGDGTDTVPQPASTVQHHYEDSGTYTAKLTATDAAGKTDTAVTTFAISAATVTPATKPTVVSFTFDDTFVNQLSAASVLHSHNMNGTFYVNSPRLTNPGSLYMSKAQADELKAAGDEIGGHTLDHVDLAADTVADATHEICDDRTALVGMGYPGRSFAYPFGSTNATVDNIVKSCGYTSARSIANLRSPGYGCFNCDTANSIPPVNAYEINTNQSVQSDTTAEMLETYVTQAESDQGGWVPLVFHSICSGCASNAMDINTFTTFVDWLSQRPSTTIVKTVDAVMGATQPPPPPPGGNPTLVTIGTQNHVITGVNTARVTNALVLYNPDFGVSTGTNEFGAEATVINGKVTKLENSVGNTVIPSNGYVLSGHGTSRTWLLANAKVDTTVTLNGDSTPPPPSTIPTGTVTIGTQSHTITGQNIRRVTDSLIVYTPAMGATTGTNEFGYEAQVVNGVVTKVESGVGNMAIPTNGYVLSGHGTSRTWLQTNAIVGSKPH